MTDEQGAEHVIQRANGTGAGNQRAIPVKSEQSNTTELPAPTTEAQGALTWKRTPDGQAYASGSAQAPLRERAPVGEVPAPVQAEIERINRPEAEQGAGSVESLTASPPTADTTKTIPRVPTAAPPAHVQAEIDRINGKQPERTATVAPRLAPPRKTPQARELINLDKLQITAEEKQHLARVIEESAAKSGYEKRTMTFDEIRKEAADLDPEIVSNLRKPDDPALYNPAVRLAVKERVNALNRELVKTQDELARRGDAMPIDELERTQAREVILRRDLETLVNTLYPSRRVIGRLLAAERMMTEATGFDVERHISRARRIAEQKGIDVKGEDWQQQEQTIRKATAAGSTAEKALAELEAKLVELRAAPEIRAAVKAYTDAIAQKVSERQAQSAARRAAAEGYKAKLMQMEQAARARLAERLNPNTLHDVSDIAGAISDISIVGASKLVRRGIDKALWAREMIDEFGEQVRPHLGAIFERSYRLYRDERQTAQRAADTLRVTGHKPEDFTTEQIATLIDRMNAERSRVLKARRDLAQTFARLQPDGFLRAFTGVRKSGLLASAIGAGRDIISTGLFQLTDEIARLPGSIMDIALSAVTKNGRTLLGPQPLVLLKATGRGYRQAVKEAPQVLREGATREQLERLELPFELRSRSRVANAIVNYVGRYRTIIDLPAYNQAFERARVERAILQAKHESKYDSSLNVRRRAREILSRRNEALDTLAATDAAVMTFHDASVVSRPIAAARQASAGADAAISVVLPFDRANTSVFLKGLQYSGLGVVESGVRGFHALYKGSFTPEQQRAMAQSFGRGATGLALVPLGYALAGKDLITGTTDDKQGQAERDRAVGRQALSFYNPITKGWTKLELLGPAAIPLAIGATIYRGHNQTEAQGGGHYARAASEILMQAPQLRGAKEAVQLVTGTGGDLATRTGRFLGGFIPSASSDLAWATDSRERDAQSFKGQIYNRVPGLRNTLAPQLDVLGREVTGKSREGDEFDAALVRLGLPLSAPTKKPDETPEQFRARSIKQGQTVERVLHQVIASSEFKGLGDDAQRQRVWRGLREFANRSADEGFNAAELEHNTRLALKVAAIDEDIRKRLSVSDEARAKVVQAVAAPLREQMVTKYEQGNARALARHARALALADRRVAQLMSERSLALLLRRAGVRETRRERLGQR